MSEETRREYYFAKRRVFRLRCEGDGEKMVDLETWIAPHPHPVTLLPKLMRMPEVPLVMRLDCANAAARYLYWLPKPQMVMEYERRSSHVAGGLADLLESDR
jgi:hypothetical protein